MTTPHDPISAKVAKHLLAIKAVQLSPQEPFTWASGILSPIYCDNRVALSHPDVRDFLVQALVERCEAFPSFNTVAGVATAGIPHGALLADRLRLPFVYVRSAAKDHGRRNLIEGVLPTDAHVLVVEDLISTGGSCLAAVDALRDAGATISGVLAIFQYGFDQAARAFSEKKVTFATLSHYDVLVDEALKTGYISNRDYDTLRRWRDNPDGWGALFAAG